MTQRCDFAGCGHFRSKQLALRGVGLFARFQEDTLDLCSEHYIEVLNLLWQKRGEDHDGVGV